MIYSLNFGVKVRCHIKLDLARSIGAVQDHFSMPFSCAYGVCVIAFLSPLRGLLISHPPITHGLRRGLHSFAASRLVLCRVFHFSRRDGATTQPPFGTMSEIHASGNVQKRTVIYKSGQPTV
jgi:hypothetical protein